MASLKKICNWPRYFGLEVKKLIAQFSIHILHQGNSLINTISQIDHFMGCRGCRSERVIGMNTHICLVD